MTSSRKILYSLGSIASSLPYQAFSTYVIFYYVDVLRLPAGLVSAGMLVYGLWNAVNDPLAGQISDRTRTRWGRRIPYIALGMVPLAVCFALVWTPPFRAGAAGVTSLFVWFLATIFLFDGIYTWVILNWTALFPEMFPGLAERAEVASWRQVFSIVGMMVGVALPPVLYSRLGWGPMAWIFSAITVASLALCLLSAKEDPRFSEQQGLPLFESIRRTFGNRSFLHYVAASMALQFTFVMLTGSMPFYTKYVLKVAESQTTIMFASVFAGALVFIPLWSWLAVRLGGRRVIMLAAAVFGAAFVPFWFITSYTGALVTSVLLGAGLSGLLVLLDVLIADVIDEDELRTGCRREGMYFGVQGFMIRLGVSLQALVMGFVLESTGYSALATVQPAGAVAGMRLLVSGVPLVAVIVALASLYFYPLDGQRLQAVRAALAAKR